MNKYDIVEVTWFDAQSSMNSFTIKEVIEELRPLYTKSCGYLINKNKESVILGFMIFGDEIVKHHQCIPQGMIQNIKVIKKK